ALGPNAVRKTGLSGNFRVRERQMALVIEAMAGRPGVPALALGDYNMTEGNDTYQIATAALTDAWLVAGRGPGWTWPRADYPPRRPALRLDYCFCTAKVRPAAMHVIYEPLGSDHCPIVVDIAYGKGPL
ncbi:MAG TPA: endonuclease/exonuclease/phosphatase family protein, partial [Anaerolineae bacterium]